MVGVLSIVLKLLKLYNGMWMRVWELDCWIIWILFCCSMYPLLDLFMGGEAIQSSNTIMLLQEHFMFFSRVCRIKKIFFHFSKYLYFRKQLEKKRHVCRA